MTKRRKKCISTYRIPMLNGKWEASVKGCFPSSSFSKEKAVLGVLASLYNWP